MWPQTNVLGGKDGWKPFFAQLDFNNALIHSTTACLN